MTVPILTVKEVSKRYGAVKALSGISTSFFPGEIHAVLGENGAGKSTLMGVLSGFVSPEKGEVLLRGNPAPLGQSHAMRAMGVGMVHQHFMLVPEFTVGQNLALAELGGLSGYLDEPRLIAGALQWAIRLGWTVDPSVKTRDLPVGAQQRIEILKALAGDGDILILDEPTAVLTPSEAEELFVVLRRLRDEGKAVILIAHKISEIIAAADRVTVLRKGLLVASCPMAQTNPDQLSEWMVGEVPAAKSTGETTVGSVLVRAEHLGVKGDRGEVAVSDLTFQICAGEVFGVGGVDGNGQLELAEAIAGVRDHEGQFHTAGSIAYVPQDRHRDGLALNLSIEENLTLGALQNLALGGRRLFNLGKIREWALGLISSYEIKVGSISDPVSSLSGGNQQKIIVARSLSNRPDIIVAINPTRGLDLKATSFVHDQLRLAQERGAAILLVSTDLAELQALSTRLTYLSRGSFSDHLVGAF